MSRRPVSRVKRAEQQQHVFTCIVKVFQAGNPAGAVMLYRRIYNLQRLRVYLDRVFPERRCTKGELGAWLWVNVFTKLPTADTEARGQLGSFTRRGPWPPTRPRLKF